MSTKAEAELLLQAVRKQHGIRPDDPYGPQLVKDWDWLGGYPVDWAVIWEEGPFEWAHLFPYGGIEEEFGLPVPDVSDLIPDGFYSEAMTSWAVYLCPNR